MHEDRHHHDEPTEVDPRVRALESVLIAKGLVMTHESFNAKLRDKLLNGEVFTSLAEARIVIEGWRKHTNTVRPHSSLGCKPPAPAAIPWPAAPTEPASPATPAMAVRPAMH